MRKYLYILITLLLVPVLVNAETLTYNICKSGCEYSTYEEVYFHIEGIYDEVGKEMFSNYDIIINYKDSETYEEQFFGVGKVNSLTVNGNNANIIVDYTAFTSIDNVILNNLNINAQYAEFVGKIDYSKLGNPDYNEYKNYVFSIKNCSIKTAMIYLNGGMFNISNSSLTGARMVGSLSSINLKDTTISPIIVFEGFLGNEFGYDSNIYLDLNNLDKNKKIIRGLYTEENISEFETKYPELNESNIQLDKYIFIEFPITEEHINNGITKTNNIFIKQEVSKTIKANTNISEFESEFVNTYEDSIGYDDIKDLPIEWKSENESVAKLENGVIVPVSAGNVDLVGTRGNDIYTIHLTVEKETIPEKIDKMTIKVPITGSKFKAWVVVVSVVLLGVIGTCSYMLIRRK